MKRKLTFTDLTVWLGYFAIIAGVALIILELFGPMKHENVEPNWKSYNEIKRIYNETR